MLRGSLDSSSTTLGVSGQLQNSFYQLLLLFRIIWK